MADASSFWRNSELHDATMLLSSDRLLLDHTHAALQDTLNHSSANPKKRKAASLASEPSCTQGSCNQSSGAPDTDLAAASVAPGQVLSLPVHRIVLSLGSAYFKTAVSTLIGDSAAADGQDLARPAHPIIVVHEEDVEAAQAVLQFLYTKTLDSSFSTAQELMRMLVVGDL